MILAAGLALVTTGLLLPPVIQLLRRRGLLDRPGPRSSHLRPTPRGGGIAVAIGCLVGFAITPALASANRLWIASAGVLFGSVGLLDDVGVRISARRRLAVQCLLATLTVGVFFRPSLSSDVVKIGSFALVGLWLVAYVNAFNFMDGINGLSAGQTIVAGVWWAIIGHAEHVTSLEAAGLIIAAAAIAFLPFNAPTAIVFLGDVGSYFLGAVIAICAVFGLRAGLSIEVVLAPLALYLADTGYALVRRISSGEAWHEPHRSHVYQQWTRRGHSHAAVAASASGVMCMACIISAVSLIGGVLARVLADVALGGVVSVYVASPRLRSPFVGRGGERP